MLGNIGFYRTTKVAKSSSHITTIQQSALGAAQSRPTYLGDQPAFAQESVTKSDQTPPDAKQ